MDRVESQDMEVVLVQAWLIWNQRNRVVHGGKFHDPGWLNDCAREFLEEHWTAQEYMGIEHVMQPNRDTWQPPHSQSSSLILMQQCSQASIDSDLV